jgi:hypothetical protein
MEIGKKIRIKKKRYKITKKKKKKDIKNIPIHLSDISWIS